MPRTTLFFLIAMAGAAFGSPRGIDFLVEEHAQGGGADISFSVRDGGGNSCYALLGSMGKVVAAARRDAEGWNLAGGDGWEIDGDTLTVKFERDPKVSRIYPETPGRIEGQHSLPAWTRVPVGLITERAREACAGKVPIPEGDTARIKIDREGHTVIFMGEGGKVCRVMVLTKRDPEATAQVVAP